jgi:hypothetical protein
MSDLRGQRGVDFAAEQRRQEEYRRTVVRPPAAADTEQPSALFAQGTREGARVPKPKAEQPKVYVIDEKESKEL